MIAAILRIDAINKRLDVCAISFRVRQSNRYIDTANFGILNVLGHKLRIGDLLLLLRKLFNISLYAFREAIFFFQVDCIVICIRCVKIQTNDKPWIQVSQLFCTSLKLLEVKDIFAPDLIVQYIAYRRPGLFFAAFTDFVSMFCNQAFFELCLVHLTTGLYSYHKLRRHRVNATSTYHYLHADRYSAQLIKLLTVSRKLRLYLSLFHFRLWGFHPPAWAVLLLMQSNLHPDGDSR